MDETERQDLARRLSEMKFKDVRKELRRIDPDADLKVYRNSMWDEYHTLYVLPNADLSVTLVEKMDLDETDIPVASGPGDQKKLKREFNYVEARVTPLGGRRAKNSTGAQGTREKILPTQ
jgi:hypothetical protein